MITVIVQIGNTDDKLSQAEWAKYFERTYQDIQTWAKEIHFSGGSKIDAPWQNACFVFIIDKDELIHGLLPRLQIIKNRFKQDSIAITVGETEFI